MPEPTQTNEAVHAAIWEVLTDGLPAVLTAHMRLDGDAVGSALALWHALRLRGVEAYAFFEPPTPPMFDFLQGMESRCSDVAQLPPAYNLVVLDCGSLERVGDQAGQLTGRARTVNIDHHDSNAFFGDVNYVSPDASSCGEMVHGLLAGSGVPVTPAIAECIFTAIVTDTGQFSHQDTTPEALDICAECMRAGARPHDVVQRVFLSPSQDQVRLRQMSLGTLEFHDEGRIATMVITGEMFRQTKLGPIDTEGFAEAAIAIQGVEASALLKEMPGCGYIKVSMRSRDSVDVCAVARLFGGGGHVHAAGCEIADSLENVRHTIAEQLEKHLHAAGPG